MFEFRWLARIADIAAGDWNAVCASDYPFIRHEFLAALEQTGAVSAEAGWIARHLVVYDAQQLVAVMPGYIKTHSYGEFVFDFAWAEAYERHGLAYYPKWISAIPFSPVSGPRFCVRPGANAQAIIKQLLAFIEQQCTEQHWSSWHVLFPEHSFSGALAAHQLIQRKAVHFQWFNHNYESFEDFLAGCTSRKRKDIRKERERVHTQGIYLQRIEGHAITTEHWEAFFDFYQLTYLKRSGHGGYLGREFFTQLGKCMPENLLLVIAYQQERIIAAALNLKDSTTLYGRYWGAEAEFDSLHFEACFYQGIEYCIEHKLQRFDPGAQGEHKIQRGFRPIYTYSNHFIADTRFREAIARFIQQEDDYLARYKADAETYLPFKQA